MPEPRAGEGATARGPSHSRDDRYAHPKKVECHQGDHPSCSGEWCTCTCHNRRKK